MRVLHTADWHLGKLLEGRSRLEEQARLLDELAQLVKDERIDLVLLAGDVYDSVNPPSAAELLFYDGIARIADGGRLPIVTIAGNHDNPERLAASGPLAERQGITLIGLPSSDPVTVDVARTGERAVIAALPYPSESRLRELLTEAFDEETLRGAYSERVAGLMKHLSRGFRADTINLAMSHLYVLGGYESDSERPIQVGGAYTVDPSVFACGAQYTALGHLHRPQEVKGPGRIRYCGSPLAYSFSEAGQAKSVTVLELAPGAEAPVGQQELFLSAGRPLVRWQAKAGLEEVHRWIDEGRDANAWIELDIHLTESMGMEQIGQLRKRHAGIVTIRPVYRVSAGEDEPTGAAAEREGLPVDELFRRFYTRQTGGAQAEPELVQLFMELLLEGGEPADEERGKAG
ncbi:exonuclease SbcCD subunit D [Paenibacillus koleovorans]|uniref:exonuclease SbcCD subunit D n=1 Tax=Paenibacillus koleovorans TaxID=121608 RepID=UPI000FDAD845|nr:exonuclease SbcCD subunit D [Paenibacillus koleovorans]